jgi:integrase
MIVVLWRAGLRIQEALTLAEQDLDQRRGSLLVGNGKGGRRREVSMDDWGWEQLRPWLAERVELPVGPLFCIIDGSTHGRPWSGAAVRSELRRLAARAKVRRRFAPHQLRHAQALELAREGVPLNIIQRQLGHTNLGTTSIYLQGIDPEGTRLRLRTRAGSARSQPRAAAGHRGRRPQRRTPSPPLPGGPPPASSPCRPPECRAERVCRRPQGSGRSR